jgi:hypothetical protein
MGKWKHTQNYDNEISRKKLLRNLVVDRRTILSLIFEEWELWCESGTDKAGRR